MHKYVIVIILAALCVCVHATDSLAVTIKGRPPQFEFGGDPNDPDDPIGLNYEIAQAFNTALEMANDAVKQYHDQDRLAQAFGDASAFSSHAVEFWGYEGYDKIAFMGGLSLALQMPSLDSGAFPDAVNEIEENGDASIGASLGGGINLGVHLGWISTRARDWYINFKFFMYNLDIPYQGYTFHYNNRTLGFGLNYQLVRPRKFGKNLFLWRGISVSSHFLFQRSSMAYAIDIEDQVAEVEGFEGYNLEVLVKSKINMEVTIDTYTLPIDIVTSLRILYFLNISMGAGIDFNFGSSTVAAQAKAHGDVEGDIDPSWGYLIPGYVTGTTDADGAPYAISGRLMAGLGITIGPAVLCDFTLTYYFTTGVAMNISAGFAW